MTNHAGNEPTAEQVLVDEWIRQADRAKSMTGMAAIWLPDAEETLDALRANGLLSEGIPSEEQVEAAAKTLHETRNPWFAAYGDWGAAGFGIKQAFRESARAALVAAGVAPQEPSQNETKSGNNFVSLDPEKVADVIEIEIEGLRHETRLYPDIYKRQVADALCEAYTEGKLTK